MSEELLSSIFMNFHLLFMTSGFEFHKSKMSDGRVLDCFHVHSALQRSGSVLKTLIELSMLQRAQKDISGLRTASHSSGDLENGPKTLILLSAARDGSKGIYGLRTSPQELGKDQRRSAGTCLSLHGSRGLTLEILGSGRAPQRSGGVRDILKTLIEPPTAQEDSRGNKSYSMALIKPLRVLRGLEPV